MQSYFIMGQLVTGSDPWCDPFKNCDPFDPLTHFHLGTGSKHRKGDELPRYGLRRLGENIFFFFRPDFWPAKNRPFGAK